MHKMSNRERIEALISYYSEGNKSMFGRLLGLQPSSITNWIRRDVLDFELVYSKCAGLNPHWLLTGEGDMLLDAQLPTEAPPCVSQSPENTLDTLISAVQQQARELGALQYQLEEEKRKHSETRKELANALRGLDSERLKTAGNVDAKETAHAAYTSISQLPQKAQLPEK